MKILTARYVVPVCAEVIENGGVAFENDVIVAVGKKADIIEKFPESDIEDFGEAAILPGFVNAHAHLELTAMRGFLDRFDDDFTSWLLTLTKVRAEILTDEDVQNAAILGAVEGAHAGVTCFGDIGRFARHGFEALKRTGLRGVAFQETEFSPLDETAQNDFEKLKEKFLVLKESETALVKMGLSPHSPYTVGARLFEKPAHIAVRVGFDEPVSGRVVHGRQHDRRSRSPVGRNCGSMLKPSMDLSLRRFSPLLRRLISALFAYCSVRTTSSSDLSSPSVTTL